MKIELLKLFKIWFIKLRFPQYWKLPSSLLYAQAWHETGGFTSAIFKENANWFGMKEAKIRKRSVEGTSRGHALYKSDWQAIYDYFLRQENFKIPYVTESQYILDTVKSGYAEDTRYQTKWIATYQQLKKPSLMFVFLFVISSVFGGWWLIKKGVK